MKIKYIEKNERKFLVSFFDQGGVRSISEWTGKTSAAEAVKLEGEKYNEAVVFLCRHYRRRDYHNELSRLRRKKRAGLNFLRYVEILH